MQGPGLRVWRGFQPRNPTCPSTTYVGACGQQHSTVKTRSSSKISIFGVIYPWNSEFSAPFLRKMQISSLNCGVQYAALMSSAFLMTFWALHISMHFGTLFELIYPWIPRRNKHRAPCSFLMTLLSTILTLTYKGVSTKCIKSHRNMKNSECHKICTKH